MSSKARRFMFITAVILFVVLTTGLSIFASGYRLNWHPAGGWQNLLVKTGSLLAESEPKGALASLEQIHGHYSPLEKKTDEERKTPLKLNNILPGEYLLTLDFPGYLPYQKKITIEPSMTTVLSDIVLFKNCLPMLVLATDSNNFNYRPAGRYLALPQEGIIFDLSTEKTLMKIGSDAKINWVNGNQAVDGAKVINLDQGVATDYTARLGKVDSGLVSGNFLIYSQAGILSSLEINTKKVQVLKTKNPVNTYEIIGDTLVVLSSQDADTRLEFIDYKNNTLLKETALLKAENWNLTKSEEILILNDQDHKITYLIDTKAQEVKHLLRDSSQAVFSKKEDLIYARGSEIHLYHLGSQKDFLLTRLGGEINSLSVGPTGYLVYATNQEVGTLNLDDPKKETTILFSGANISQLSFEKSDNSIFFYAEIGTHKGLYKIEL